MDYSRGSGSQVIKNQVEIREQESNDTDTDERNSDTTYSRRGDFGRKLNYEDSNSGSNCSRHYARNIGFSNKARNEPKVDYDTNSDGEE